MGANTKQRDTGREDNEHIVERYFDVCNRALAKNKDKFPYMEIWNAHWKYLSPRNFIHCAVDDHKPKTIYKLQLTEDMEIKIVDKKEAAPYNAWPINYKYLKHVVANPQAFIDHPATLNWGWLNGDLGK